MNQKIPFTASLVIFINLFACSEMSEKDILKQRVDELISIIESHKSSKIKKYLAADFSAGKDFDATRFSLFIQYQLRKNKKISILRTNETIILNGFQADITSDMFLFGINKWLPERGQTYYVESRWKKENKNWVMSRLRWQIK